MPAGKWSFIIEQGSTLNYNLQYKDSGSNPVNLTGYGAKMQIRTSYTSDPLITLSSSLQPDNTGLNMSGSNGSTSPVSGTIGLYISAYSSSLLNFDEAIYDLEISSGSVVTRILEGNVKLSKEVTR